MSLNTGNPFANLGGGQQPQQEQQPAMNQGFQNLGNLSGLGQQIGEISAGQLHNGDGITQMLLGDDKITVVKGVFMLAPGVKETVLRPHHLDTNSSSSIGALDLLGNLLADQGTIPEQRLRQLGSQIITCTADHEGVVAIPYGWGGKRLRFMLVFKVETRSITYYEVLTGYTDYDQPSIGPDGKEGNVDPNMRLFFNNALRFKPSFSTNALGVQTESLTLMSTHQIMTMRDGEANFDALGFNRPAPKELITPTTLFQRMEVNSASFGNTGQGVLDTRTRVGTTGGVTMTNRFNTLGSNFFSNTVRGVGNALADLGTSASGGMNLNRRRIYTSASDHTVAGERNAIEDVVLSRIRESSDYGTRGSVTWQRFKEMFPESNTTCKVVRHADLQESYQYHQTDTFNLGHASASNSENWNSSHLATVKAQQLLTSIPALMTNSLLTSVTFSATNMVTGGFLDPFEFKPTAATSYLGDGVNISPLIDLFMSEFRQTIHPVLSDNNEKHYTFTMHCDVLGEMRMTIYYDGMPHSYNYSAGAYCDHLYSPALSGDATRLNGLATDFDGILSNLYHY